MKIAVRSAEGTPIDAHFEFEDGAIIFHSRGGTIGSPNATNTQYADGLRLVLERLAEAAVPIDGIWVDSSRVQHLPLNERLIVSLEEASIDVSAVFSLASRRMQRVGSVTDGAKGGNSNKRLKIGLGVGVVGVEIIRLVSGADVPFGNGATDVTPENVLVSEAFDHGPDESVSMPSGRVWVTSFWGFNPEGDGYFGFTRQADREWFLSQLRPGDLVMVYATSTSKTDEELRGRILGFLEVEHRRMRDTERMSPEGHAWKVEAGVTERWTYAVPVVRAWRAVDRQLARTVAPETLGPRANHQLIASRGALLTEDEATRALEIPVRSVDVYGAAGLNDEEKAKLYVPSRGFPMSFGKRSFETIDGEHFLYALQLTGDASAILNDPPHFLRGKVIVKVGLAKDPVDRCAQHNAALPPAGRMRWSVLLKSGPLPCGQAALDAETFLKDSFGRAYQSLGGEFFLCEEKTLPAQFAVCARGRPRR